MSYGGQVIDEWRIHDGEQGSEGGNQPGVDDQVSPICVQHRRQTAFDQLIVEQQVSVFGPELRIQQRIGLAQHEKRAQEKEQSGESGPGERRVTFRVGFDRSRAAKPFNRALPYQLATATPDYCKIGP